MRWIAFLTICVLSSTLGAQKAVSQGLYDDLRRASASIEVGELEEAEWLLSKLVADAPDFAGAWFQLAICRRLREDMAGAAQAVERAVGLDPDNVQALVLGVEVFAKVDKMRAVALARRTVETTEDPKPMRRVLDVLVELREVETALPILDKVLAASPKDLGLLEVKARLALEAKQPELAVEAYRAMLQVEPVNPPVMHSLARVQLHLGKRAEATRTLESMLQMNPSNIPAREQLLGLLVEDGADGETIAMHRRYLSYYRYWAKKRAEKGEQARPGK